APRAALEILGGVEADAEDPGLEVLHPGNAVEGAPAAQERLLGDVLSVLLIAEDEPERADEVVAQGVERPQQHLPWGRRCLGGVVGLGGNHTRARSVHQSPFQTSGMGGWIAPGGKNEGWRPAAADAKTSPE